MGLIQQNLESVNFVAGHPTAARTATGQTSGIDVRDYDGDLVFILDSAAGGGSSPRPAKGAARGARPGRRTAGAGARRSP